MLAAFALFQEFLFFLWGTGLTTEWSSFATQQLIFPFRGLAFGHDLTELRLAFRESEEPWGLN